MTYWYCMPCCMPAGACRNTICCTAPAGVAAPLAAGCGCRTPNGAGAACKYSPSAWKYSFNAIWLQVQSNLALRPQATGFVGQVAVKSGIAMHWGPCSQDPHDQVKMSRSNSEHAELDECLEQCFQQAISSIVCRLLHDAAKMQRLLTEPREGRTQTLGKPRSALFASVITMC